MKALLAHILRLLIHNQLPFDHLAANRIRNHGRKRPDKIQNNLPFHGIHGTQSLMGFYIILFIFLSFCLASRHEVDAAASKGPKDYLNTPKDI